MPSALSGITILDLTQVMAGPFCCQILGDLGADVIKVEPLHSGDASRTGMGTPLEGGDSSAFLAVNRNKRSIAVDLKSPDGRRVFFRLLESADVLVENFRPGVTKRLGVDYETVRHHRPELIYASISGFGQTGPYADRPGYDLIAQAMSGVMSVTGPPGGEPTKSGVPLADLSAGMFAALGVLAACQSRHRTGVGQHIDVSLYESALALSIWETAELWATGRVPGPVGSAHRMSAPYQTFRASDGHVVLGANNPRQWERLCAVLARPDLLADERFATNESRMSNRQPLVIEIEEALSGWTTDDAVAALLSAGVPAGPIRDYQQVCSDPHTIARDMVVAIDHPTAGTVNGLGIPIKLSATPGSIRRPAPLLGEHTDELLTNAGYSEAERRHLRGTDAVG